MKPIDPLQLQRLVDGELDNPQVQQMLDDAQASPDQWQEIAVGFVENQIWNRAFVGDESASTDEPAASTQTIEVSKSEQSFEGQNFSWWILAASLMLAGAIGFMLSELRPTSVPQDSIVENAPTSSVPELSPQLDQPKITPAVLKADYHLEVPPDNAELGELANAAMPASVPLFSIRNMDQLRQVDRQQTNYKLPPELLEELQGSGYQMQQNVKFLSGQLGDGRSFVVPVRTIRFLPGQ